jgi:hypothetical protein
MSASDEGGLNGQPGDCLRDGWSTDRWGVPRCAPLSDADVPIEHISPLVGHSSTTTTETIYRKQIGPVIVHGADTMDRIFPASRSTMSSHSPPGVILTGCEPVR